MQKIQKKKKIDFSFYLRSGDAESCCDIQAPSVQQTSSHEQQAACSQKSYSVRSRLYMESHRPCFRRSGASQWDWSHFRYGKVNPRFGFFVSPPPPPTSRFGLTRETGFLHELLLSTINISSHTYRRFFSRSLDVFSAANKWLQFAHEQAVWRGEEMVFTSWFWLGGEKKPGKKAK